MQDSGRITAAIDIVAEIEDRRRPAKLALKDWGANHRFAGSKDRAWVSGLVLDTLRHRRSLSRRIGVDGPRARVLACLAFSWGWDVERIAAAAAEPPHGTGPLFDDERAGLGNPRSLDDAPAPIAGDYPDWLEPHMARAFGDDRVAEAQALSSRAPVDLRVNTLKTDAEKALKALASVNPQAGELLATSIRLPTAKPEARGEHVESIPAYSKGWVEVQDLGSQIAAACAGDIRGAQVLDFCAGGGGKTLAMAAAMANTGQIYAWDADARRLAPIFARAERAGVRNLQIRSPKDPKGEGGLDDLKAKMDLVFVDAPCTGSGVWRRQPDAKWRLRAGQVERRMEEQDEALSAAAEFVKPGGRLVYVTCSLFVEENEDRVAAFLDRRTDFARRSAIDALAASGAATEAGLARLTTQQSPDGALRLSPRSTGTDGFFIAALARNE